MIATGDSARRRDKHRPDDWRSRSPLRSDSHSPRSSPDGLRRFRRASTPSSPDLRCLQRTRLGRQPQRPEVATPSVASRPSDRSRAGERRPSGAGLPAGPRRSPCVVDHRGAAVSRWCVVGGRWISRRRIVLRAVGLPDHLAVDRRVVRLLADPAWGVLGSAGAPAAARVVRAGCRDRRVLHDRRPPEGGPGAEIRRDRRPPVRGKLAPDRDRQQLLRRQRACLAAAAHMVAGDRGAVLSPVADHPGHGVLAHRSAGCERAPVARDAAGGDDRCRARVRRRDGDSLPWGHGARSRLLRDRYEGDRPAGRRVASHGDRAVEAGRTPLATPAGGISWAQRRR